MSMNEKQEKHIVVTGAGGLVGHGILALLKKTPGYRVTGVYQTHKPLIAAKHIRYVQGDLTQESAWHELGHIPADVLIHCAAVIPRSFISEDQEEAKHTNLLMDGHAISYALGKICTLTYLSSAGLYGFKIKTVCNEQTTPELADAYFSGKLETENTIIGLGHRLRHFIFRISAPYGPHQRKQTVMNIFINNALADKPLCYYGSGSRTQDFIYVEDIAQACLRTVNSQNYGVYNIASGCPVSMKTLAHRIKELTGSKSDIRAADITDPQEGFRALFDITKAKTLLDWHPHYNLERGVREVIDHLECRHS